MNEKINFISLKKIFLFIIIICLSFFYIYLIIFTFIKKIKYLTNYIPQKKSNSEKLNIFNSVLSKESDNDEVYPHLYKDSISLYGKTPSFELLINNIYVKIYKN